MTQVLVDVNLGIDDLSYKIIGAAIEVHKTLGGPGLIESIYEAALCQELALIGIKVEQQVPLQVNYKGFVIKDPYIIDILIPNKIIIEVKATEKNYPIYESQLLTYLRLSGIKLGLLINFGYSQVSHGIARVVNNF